jgi:Ca2+-binding RTX toxin-like protein
MRGGGGNDVLRDIGGTDVLKGGAGADKLFARDGKADSIRCGGGEDLVKADPKDEVRGC